MNSDSHQNKIYNVFLSYNGEDRQEVAKIAEYLANQAKLKPWFDQWELVPGEPWIRALERGLFASKTCAVFIGKSGQGPWQRQEVEAALMKRAENEDFRIIPVLLPMAPEKPEVPIFLAGSTWVEFEIELEDDHALWRLECGIKGIAPGQGRAVSESVFPLPDSAISHKDKKDEISSKVCELFYPGGAIDVDSEFYVARQADNEVLSAIHRPRSLVTIRGPRQTGKTSLMIRVCKEGKRAASQLRVVFIDLEILPKSAFNCSASIWQAIAFCTAQQLELADWTTSFWDSDVGHDHNLTKFFDQFVFKDDETPLLIGMDETDRVFGTPVKEEFFATIRGFWSRGAFDATWKKIRWLLSASSEPSFFIEDITQSPFNIGQTVELSAFTQEEIRVFARNLNLELEPDIVGEIQNLTGGRPVLVHMLLYQLKCNQKNVSELFDAWIAGNTLFRNHLQGYLLHFQRDPALAQAMKDIIGGRGCQDLRLIDRLKAAGLVRLSKDNDPNPACRLYSEFFKKFL